MNGMASRKAHPVKNQRPWKRILMYSLPGVLLIIGGLAYMTNAATENDPNALTEDDQTFLLYVAEGRMMDWAEGNLAVDKGSNTLYRQYGKRVMHDQDKMMQDLHALAASKNLKLPEKLSRDRKKDLNYLKAARGEWFDRRFRRMIIKDHKKDISAFEAAAESQDPEIKEFAKRYLPLMEEHLQLARDLNQ